MNRILAVALLAVTMVTCQDHGSGNCCGPQPISIQLSCDGKSQPPPPPPPAQGNDTANPCEFDANGNPISNPPGGFPPGFRLVTNELGIPEAHVDDPVHYPYPPKNWDGEMDHFGFELPQPGTPHYNMVMCTPQVVVTNIYQLIKMQNKF